MQLNGKISVKIFLVDFCPIDYKAKIRIKITKSCCNRSTKWH